MKDELKKNNLSEKNETENEKLGPKKLLRFMASAVLKKYHPRIVAITGTLGETLAKEAIFAVISGHYFTRKNEKKDNGEFGVLLAIIGAKSGSGLLGIFFRWIFMLIFPIKYPEILILEMGADRPGSLKYLMDFISPDISVITEIIENQAENFRNIEAFFKEKATVARTLSENGILILNSDDLSLLKLKDNPRQFGVAARIFSFGFLESADARAMDVFLNYRNDESSALENETNNLSFKLNYKGTTMPLRLSIIPAKHNIYAALAGVSVGIELGLNLVEIAKNLENFSLPFEDNGSGKVVE